jgi:hypothetical protein
MGIEACGFHSKHRFKNFQYRVLGFNYKVWCLKVQSIHGVDGLTEDEVCRTFTCSQTSSSSGPKSKPCAWDEKNPILRIENHVLGIKKLFLTGFGITGSWERKKKECTKLSPMQG